MIFMKILFTIFVLIIPNYIFAKDYICIEEENTGFDVFTFSTLSFMSNFLAGETTTSIQLIPFNFRSITDNSDSVSNKIITKPKK